MYVLSRLLEALCSSSVGHHLRDVAEFLGDLRLICRAEMKGLAAGLLAAPNDASNVLAPLRPARILRLPARYLPGVDEAKVQARLRESGEAATHLVKHPRVCSPLDSAGRNLEREVGSGCFLRSRTSAPPSAHT